MTRYYRLDVAANEPADHCRTEITAEEALRLLRTNRSPNDRWRDAASAEAYDGPELVVIVDPYVGETYGRLAYRYDHSADGARGLYDRLAADA